ncbi:hypothetical protein D3C86_2206710 [compost metagenome]
MVHHDVASPRLVLRLPPFQVGEQAARNLHQGPALGAVVTLVLASAVDDACLQIDPGIVQALGPAQLLDDP